MSRLIFGFIVFCLTVLPTYAQMKAELFGVGTVVHSKFDTSQVFSVTHYWLPEDKQFSESDANKRVECVENELKATGIYSKVKTYLFETIKENSRGLEVQVEYPNEFERFVISDIVLEGFPEVEPAKFQAALDVRGVELNIPFLKYKFDKLEDKISSALREAYPKYLKRNYNDGKLYISVRLSGDKQVRLVVSTTFPEC